MYNIKYCVVSYNPLCSAPWTSQSSRGPELPHGLLWLHQFLLDFDPFSADHVRSHVCPIPHSAPVESPAARRPPSVPHLRTIYTSDRSRSLTTIAAHRPSPACRLQRSWPLICKLFWACWIWKQCGCQTYRGIAAPKKSCGSDVERDRNVHDNKDRDFEIPTDDSCIVTHIVEAPRGHNGSTHVRRFVADGCAAP